MDNKKIFEVQIVETYKANVIIEANSEEEALKITKSLYENGLIELDSEDISDTEYKII